MTRCRFSSRRLLSGVGKNNYKYYTTKTVKTTIILNSGMNTLSKITCHANDATNKYSKSDSRKTWVSNNLTQRVYVGVWDILGP